MSRPETRPVSAPRLRQRCSYSKPSPSTSTNASSRPPSNPAVLPVRPTPLRTGPRGLPRLRSRSQPPPDPPPHSQRRQPRHQQPGHLLLRPAPRRPRPPPRLRPRFFIHDSHLFDGVDNRQLAAALKLAADVTREEDPQYIAAFNSDDLGKATRRGFDPLPMCGNLTCPIASTTADTE
ncbi:DUF2326 domain-containing protein [Streptomyces sp. NPDC003015]